MDNEQPIQPNPVETNAEISVGPSIEPNTEANAGTNVRTRSRAKGKIIAIVAAVVVILAIIVVIIAVFSKSSKPSEKTNEISEQKLYTSTDESALDKKIDELYQKTTDMDTDDVKTYFEDLIAEETDTVVVSAIRLKYISTMLERAFLHAAGQLLEETSVNDLTCPQEVRYYESYVLLAKANQDAAKEIEYQKSADDTRNICKDEGWNL